MGRDALLGSIYAALRADSALAALLGPVSAANRRIYRTHPQVPPVLTGIQPAAEGWLVVTEAVASQEARTEQRSTIHEISDIQCYCYTTTMALAQAVIGRIDTLYHWRIPQQQDIQYGDYLLLLARRFALGESYDKDTNLYQTEASYRLTWVRATPEN